MPWRGGRRGRRRNAGRARGSRIHGTRSFGSRFGFGGDGGAPVVVPLVLRLLSLGVSVLLRLEIAVRRGGSSLVTRVSWISFAARSGPSSLILSSPGSSSSSPLCLPLDGFGGIGVSAERIMARLRRRVGRRKAERERENGVFLNSERTALANALAWERRRMGSICYWDMHGLFLGQVDRWASILGPLAFEVSRNIFE